MVQDNETIHVRNLTNQRVAYTLPETNTKRRFVGFESKPVTAREMRDLYYSQGGSNLLLGYLAVDNKELAEEFGIESDLFDHEYSWTEQDIERVLLEDDIDVLKDAFDFAPVGICETLAAKAVELEIADMNKRNYIQQVTKRDVTKMINYAHELKSISNDDDSPAPARRRRVGNNTSTQSSRRRVG